jgi:hypothetical protein
MDFATIVAVPSVDLAASQNRRLHSRCLSAIPCQINSSCLIALMPSIEQQLLGLVRLCWIAPGIVPANQSLYKLEKQSG